MFMWATVVPLLAVAGMGIAIIHDLVASDRSYVRRTSQSVLPLLLLRSRLGDRAALRAFTDQPGSAAAYSQMYAATKAEFSAVGPHVLPVSATYFHRAQASLSQADGLMRTWLSQSPNARHYSLAVSEKAYTADVAAAREALDQGALAARQLNVKAVAAQRNVERDAVAEMAMLALASMVLVALMSSRLARGIVRPVRDICAGLAVMGAGQLSFRIDGLDGEFGVVASSVNLMAGQLERQHEALRRGALHDSLTGLPNRTHLLRELESALERAPSDAAAVAVCIFDLDRFKEINDTLGHSCGDRLLALVGTRLSEASCPRAAIGRLGGDEFLAILSAPLGPGDPREAARAAFEPAVRCFEHSLREPFDVAGVLLAVEASVGIASYPADGDTPEVLLSRADVALYTSKESRASREFYDPALDRSSARALALLADMRGAIASGQIVLHYQPIVSISSRSVVGFEALARWEHPAEGLLCPGEFLPLAENSGLIHELTPYVLDVALDQAKKLLLSGNPLVLSVNISARNLLDGRLPEVVAAALERHGVPSHLLKLEVTESSIVADVARARSVLDGIAGLGVAVSIDDFGTGYTCLAHLRSLPVRELKLDRCFVERMTVDQRDSSIVRTGIDLAHRLNMTVVAEGVQSEAVEAALGALGCDYVQGFLYSKPLPAADLGQFLGGVVI